MRYAVTEIWELMSSPDSLRQFMERIKIENPDRIIYLSLNDFEYWRNITPDFIALAAQMNKPIEVIAGLSSYTRLREPVVKNVTREFWEAYWLIKTFALFTRQEQSNTYHHHFVSLNNRAHPWRCNLMDLVAKKSLIPFGAISWSMEPSMSPLKYTWKYFQPKVMTLTDNFLSDYDQYSVPEEYKYSFAQLVPESCMDIIEISEKTAAPLILGKPFLVAGAAYNLSALTRLKFEPYTELFDYSFDLIANQNDRYDKLLENFENLSKVKLSELPVMYSMVKDKIEYNQHRVSEIAFDFNSYPDPIREIIDVYEVTGEILNKELIEIYTKLLILKSKS